MTTIHGSTPVTLLAAAFASSVLIGCAAHQAAPAEKSNDAPTSKNGGRAYSFQDSLKDSGAAGPEMVLVRAGTFQMGDASRSGHPDEKPAHDVAIAQPFAVGKFEVTVADFERFAQATGYKTDAERGDGCYTFDGPAKLWSIVEGTSWRNPNFPQSGDHPVVCVSWNDALAYTQWLSAQTGVAYRLPTEAEWEYVARAGTGTHYGFGNSDECDSINCCKTGTTWLTKQTRSVGSYVANPFGVFDTAGNAWEWTASEYSNRYNGKETRASDAAQLSTLRVVRGGSWYSFAIDTRAGYRGKNWPQERYSTVGFRVARDVTPEFVENANRRMATRLSAMTDAQ
jgi:formylglycine-generating enzyme required for sulfatase activity